MKAYKVMAGTTGTARDLKRFCNFIPWKASSDIIFTENEYRGLVTDDSGTKCVFVRGLFEYCVSYNNVTQVF